MSRETLGLNDGEIDWLRRNTNGSGRTLVSQYQMVVVCPSDPGARGIFDAMLSEWRKSDEYPLSRGSQS